MTKCLTCGEDTTEITGLCPDCGKMWSESLGRRSQDEVSIHRLNDLSDRLIRDYESGSPELKHTLEDIGNSVNMFRFLEIVNTLLLQKSSATHRFLYTILRKNIEHSPTPRVVLLRMLEFPQVAGVLRQESEMVERHLQEYQLEMQMELMKSISKQKSAQKLKSRQHRLQREFMVLLAFAGVSALAALLLYVTQIITPVLVIPMVGVPLLMLLIAKATRYSSLDANLKTNPHLSYQIDLLDIPESYIDNLNEQISKINRVF